MVFYPDLISTWPCVGEDNLKVYKPDNGSGEGNDKTDGRSTKFGLLLQPETNATRTVAILGGCASGSLNTNPLKGVPEFENTYASKIQHPVRSFSSLANKGFNDEGNKTVIGFKVRLYLQVWVPGRCPASGLYVIQGLRQTNASLCRETSGGGIPAGIS
ncbi:hypothetical protein PG984_011494 [Apiospora sp. TS-2023a]